MTLGWASSLYSCKAGGGLRVRFLKRQKRWDYRSAVLPWSLKCVFVVSIVDYLYLARIVYQVGGLGGIARTCVGVHIVLRVLQIPLLLVEVILQWTLCGAQAAVLVPQVCLSTYYFTLRSNETQAMLFLMSILCLGQSLWAFRVWLTPRASTATILHKILSNIGWKSMETTLNDQLSKAATAEPVSFGPTILEVRHNIPRPEEVGVAL